MNNRISIWNSDCGKFLKSIRIDRPSYMEFGDDKLFVVSYTICEESIETNRFLRITGGSNCIFVLNKATHIIIKKIELENWLQPNGLYLDAHLNIVTTAFEIDAEGIVSKNRYLFIIDENGNLMHKIEIVGILQSFYIQFIEKNIIASYDKSLKFIQFD